jgi:hypothetical protein
MSSQQDSDSDYSNLNLTGNTLVGNNDGINTSIENMMGMSNLNTNTVVLVPQNTTFEVYLPLNGRIYHVTYTELNLIGIARHLNSRLDLSQVPDDQLTHHHNIQSFIQQQFLQQHVDYNQQNNIQQQYFDTQPTPYPNNAYNAVSAPSNEATTSDDIQDTGYDRIQGNSNAQ